MEQEIKGFRISPQQQNLWRLQGNDHSTFATYGVMEISGTDDQAEILERIDILIGRLEIAYSALRLTPGMSYPLQVLEEEPLYQVITADWRDLSTKDIAQKREALTSLSGEESFDLDKGPLFRFHLITLADRFLLSVSASSLTLDLNSMRVLAKLLFSDPPPEDEDDDIMQFVDISEWQNETAASEDGAKGRQFWADRATAFPEGGRLLLEHPAPDLENFDFATHHIQMSAEQTNALTMAAERHQVDLGELLLAGWQSLLWHHGGRNQIIVGVLCDGRNYDELQDAVGPLEKCIPLQVPMNKDQSFADLLKNTNDELKDLKGWQEFFDWQIGVKHDKGDVGYFSYAFEYHDLSEVFKVNGRRVTLEDSSACREPFRLRLSSARYDHGIDLAIDYETHRFSKQGIEVLMDHLVNLLLLAVAKPDIEIVDLIVPTSKTLSTMRAMRYGKKVETSHTLIHKMFEKIAANHPDQVAVSYIETRDGEKTTRNETYGDMNKKANRLAHHLRSLNIGPESRVAIAVQRSPESVMSTLAVLKAGAAFVSLDPSQPRSRLDHILHFSDITKVISFSPLKGNFPDDMDVICLDELGDKIQKASDINPDVSVYEDNLAYIVYTSGSTGVPKGVLVTHRGLTNLAEEQREHFSLNADSRILKFAPLTFDASVWEVIMPWTVGATLCITPRDQMLPGGPLEDTLRNHRATHITLPPSALAVSDPNNLLDLQHVIVAGEACSLEVYRSWTTGRNFYNAYGPSEATVCATVYPCKGDMWRMSLGAPLANTHYALLDENCNPSSWCIMGELALGGINLARGYHGRPGRTAEQFTPDPFSKEPGARLYQTGDIGLLMPNGHLAFLGRRDHQVKIHGHRIELGEIETALTQHPRVREAVVIMTKKNAHGQVLDEERLTAFITQRSAVEGAQPVALDELRTFLENRLPRYMVPPLIVSLTDMPLTSTGKIDRKILSSPELFANVEREYVAPRTEDEECLATIWADVLDLDKVGITDNFFEIGGHSLLATQVITRVRDAFSVEISLRALLSTPTIPELLNAIEEMKVAERVELDDTESSDEEDMEEISL